LVSTADYWASRVTYNKDMDRYEILKVMPPDEDIGIVDNSVYTNAAAKVNLELAISAAKKAGKSYPAKWEEIARKMYLPFDEKNRRFLEYDGYDGHQTKQADTELLIYPLMHPMSEDVKRNTFDFYKTRANPKGPAMTSSIHAILAAELGRPDEAYEHFTASYQDFLRGPFLMFNEKRSMTYDNMCFLTGCAGTMQSVIYGFGGIRLNWRPDSGEKFGTLSFNPVLPPKWKSLKITNLQWGGKTFDLVVEQGKPYRIVEKKVAAE
jgi:trehalose/maltose hydrolase-like predicted phosphorylase